jgi:hypothetical protein
MWAIFSWICTIPGVIIGFPVNSIAEFLTGCWGFPFGGFPCCFLYFTGWVIQILTNGCYFLCGWPAAIPEIFAFLC